MRTLLLFLLLLTVLVACLPHLLDLFHEDDDPGRCRIRFVNAVSEPGEKASR